ncbi:YciI family protein [Enterovibrio paralichthyis]|uniref:YciI family protein n=1 Tax=Enterovibrio paralichthyis TaxID=2853805 RepID=UPI001C4866CC|nr:YciI family protein [Enterovibrio paralichthyis]MBV7297505.1 YciI family protein [Enterovibrio paralichthyis]
MPKFMMTYLGGNPPATPEEGQRHFADYQAWLKTLGSKAVSPANPLKGTVCVLPDGNVAEGNQTGMSGFTIIETDTLEEALEFAKTCPFLTIGGTLEVSELVEMNMS